MKTLYALPYSPWSEKARWALDHHGIEYREAIYNPPVHELYLRIRSKNLRAKVSVPTLVDGPRMIADSWEIASYAEGQSDRERLFPPPLLADIRAIDALSQRGLDAGRVLVLRQGLADEEALKEMAPTLVAKALGPLAVPVIRSVVKKTQRKWGADRRTDEEALTTFETVVNEFRKALGDKTFVYDTLTYADISGAQLLGMVVPVKHPRVRMGARTRERFSVHRLAAKFGDLLEWRDALYASRRSAA